MWTANEKRKSESKIKNILDREKERTNERKEEHMTSQTREERDQNGPDEF